MTYKPLVLLVEDSVTQAHEYKVYLERAGYDVIIAGDGVTALELAHNKRPRAIVLDVNLPEMDGFRVCRRLRRDPVTASTPVFMLTVADSANDALFGLESGADDYIPKDEFAVENLLAALRSAAISTPPEEELS